MGRISIHTPLAGSDYSYTAVSIAGLRFQSTLPLRGATETQQAGQFDALISIHTPLAGSDCHGLAGAFSSPISIHTPLAGSDQRPLRYPMARRISIHTPLAGSDTRSQTRNPKPHDFNPHSPCGERLAMSPSGLPNLSFQSTLPLRGATAVV